MRHVLAGLTAVSALLLSACGAGGGNPPVAAAPVSKGGSPAGTVFPAHYTITDLGVNALPAAVNASGSVAGTVNDRAFLYSSGFTIVFGTVTGASDSSATDLNDSGIAVGTSGADGAAFKPDGTVVDLGTPANNVYAFDLSINNTNQIVGLTALGGVAGCGGSVTSFSLTGPPSNIGGTALSAKINNSGTIAAALYDQTGLACEGTADPVLIPGFTGLTVPPAFTMNSQAGAIVTDINDGGMVTGWSPTTSNTIGSFVLQTGTSGTAILPTAAQQQLQALGINNQGWIVGTFEVPARAFAYVNGQVIDLNSLLPAGCGPWTLTSAVDINAAGDIVGVGTFGGKTHGFLLTPLP